MKILATYNIKGGVGKTAAAVNLACLAAAGGGRAILWDLDPQGAATFYYRVKPRVKGGARKLLARKSAFRDRVRGTDVEGLDLLPADLSYRRLDLALDERRKRRRRLRVLLETLGDEYDYAFLDCPPGLTLLSEAVFEAADALLVPVIPTPLSLRTLAQILDFSASRGAGCAAVLAFFSMVDRRKRLHRDILDRRDFAGGAEVLETFVPCATEVERMGLRREPLVAYAPASGGAQAYRSLWNEVLGRLGGGARV